MAYISVYSGYQTKAMDMYELLEFGKSFTRDAECLANEIAQKLVAKTCANLSDELLQCESPEDAEKTVSFYKKDAPFFYTLFDIAHLYVKNRYLEIKEKRDPEYDLGYTLTLIPIKERVLINLNAERNEYHDLLLSYPDVMTYDYDEGSYHRQEEVSKKEWKQRGRDWKNVLTEQKISDNGFSFLYSHGFPYMNVMDIQPFLPSLEARVNRVAFRNAENKVFRELQDLHPIKNKDSTYEWLHLHNKAMNYVRTDEGKVLVSSERKKILPFIHPELTPTILSLSIKQYCIDSLNRKMQFLKDDNNLKEIVEAIASFNNQ